MTNEFTYYVCTPDNNPVSIGSNPVAVGAGGSYLTCDDAAAFGFLPSESFPRFFSQLSSMIDEYNSLAGSVVRPRILPEQCYYNSHVLGGHLRDLLDTTVVYFTSNEHFQCYVRGDCSDAMRRNSARVSRVGTGIQFEVSGELGALYYCFTQTGLQRRGC